MNKLLSNIFLLLLMTGALNAQQRPLFSQYTQNLFLINPAVAGWENYVDVHSSYRKQWAGLAEGPESYYVSVQGALNYYAEPSPTLPMLSKYSMNQQSELASGDKKWYRHGAGLTAWVDRTSPLKTNTLQASYALHLKLGKELKASIGASVGLRQWRLNPSDLSLEQANDPVFSNEFMSEIIPNINIGLLLYSPQFYFSLSAEQLLKEDIGFGLAVGNAVLQQHFYLSTGYRLVAGSNWTVTPSVLVRYTANITPSVEGNVLFQYRNKLWTGVGFRQQGFFTVQAGIHLREWMNIGYLYEAITGDLSHIGNSSHEITLGLKIPVREYGFEQKYF